MDITHFQMEQEDKDGALASVVLHLAVFLLFLIPFLGRKITPPESIVGISVIFDTPFEEAEYTPIVDAPAPKAPKASKITPIPAKKDDSPPKEEVKEDVEEKVKETVKEAPAKVVNEPIKDIKTPTPVDVVSQTTTEKQAEINAAEQKAKQAAADAAEIKAQQEAEAAAKLKAQQDAEAAEAAKLKAQQEAEAAEAAKLKASKDKFGSLFGSNGGTSTSEESTDIGGSDSGELDAISTGSGGSGAGLNGRGISYKPNITDNSDKVGRVVVQICVNSSGKVISTEFVQSGSTTTDKVLINKALEGAKKYQFEVNSEIGKQCGDITIDFEVR